MRATARLAAAAVTGVLGLGALAPPAWAADPMVEWTRPTLEDNVIEEVDPTGKIAITGTITGEEAQDIREASFDLVAEPALDSQDDPCFTEAPRSTSVFPDDRPVEDFRVEVPFPCNGRYSITATVSYSDPLIVDLATESTDSSMLFSVAIPPARVEGATTTFDEGTREVRLTWARNAEADLLGYFVERNPPGPAGFSRITPDLLPPDQTSFTDPAIEDEHRYQVVAVRRGPGLEEIRGEPSAVQTTGPERTQPTLPDDLPAPNSRPPAASRGGGGDSAGRAAPAPSQTRTTSSVFEETLPFDPSRTTLPPPSSALPGDAAVLAELDDSASEDDRRATLVPVAGGLALVVGAMHLFLLSKRAGEPEDIPMSRR